MLRGERRPARAGIHAIPPAAESSGHSSWDARQPRRARPLHDQALVALDKRDKIGADGVRKELAARGVPDAAAERLVGAFGPLGAGGDLAQVNEEHLRRAREHVGAEAEGIAGVDTLTEILRLARQTSAATHLIVDTSLARGLSYYTGAIMEIAVEGIGSLGGGGRYDGLIGMFSGEQIPACGFSLGLERILVVMAERNMFPPTVQAGGPDVMVTIFDSASIEDSLRLAEELRAAGLRSSSIPNRTSSASNSSTPRRATQRSSRWLAPTSGPAARSRSKT